MVAGTGDVDDVMAKMKMVLTNDENINYDDDDDDDDNFTVC